VIAALPPPCPPAIAERTIVALTGDVDGDAYDDRVSLRGRRCLTLVVRTQRRTFVIRLKRKSDSSGAVPPVLAALPPIDRVRGAEIVLSIDYGPCSTWYRVYAVRRSGLVQLRIPGGYFYLRACSPISGVDCLRRGVVFTWTASPTTRVKRLVVRTYGVRGNRFRVVARRTLRPRYAGNRITYPGSLFEHCR
jgi:hypothetical protein